MYALSLAKKLILKNSLSVLAKLDKPHYITKNMLLQTGSTKLNDIFLLKNSVDSITTAIKYKVYEAMASNRVK